MGFLSGIGGVTVGEKSVGEPRSAVGLNPGGTANGEGGEGPAAEAAAGEPIAPTRSWVKEPWKAGEGAAARVSEPGLVSAEQPEPAAAATNKDSTAERGGRESAGRGGGRRTPSAAPAEASWAAMGREGRRWSTSGKELFGELFGGVCVGEQRYSESTALAAGAGGRAVKRRGRRPRCPFQYSCPVYRTVRGKHGRRG